MSKSVEVIGLKEMQRTLEKMLPRESNNLLRATVNGAAGEVRKLTKEEAPKQSGRLKRLIASRRCRSPPNKPVAEVYTRSGGFYWVFVNYGTRKQPANPFRDRAIARFNTRRDRYIINQFNKKLAAKIKREQKRNRRKR